MKEGQGAVPQKKADREGWLDIYVVKLHHTEF